MRSMRGWASIAVAFMMAGAVSAAGLAGGGDQAIWNDPEFKKQFLGTYGVLADVEPPIAPEDRLVLEKVYPLLSSDMAAAVREIEAAKKPGSTALFDFILGNASFQQDRIEEAGQHYQAAVTKFPSFRRAWKNLGLVKFRLGKTDDSIHSWTRMLQLGGGDALTYGLLGQAYMARQDYLAAEGAFRNALLLDPEGGVYRTELIRAVLKQEKHEEAAGLLVPLLERQPERPELWLLQASAYIGMKQPLRAAENIEIVDRMGKATPDNLNLLGDIYLNESLPGLAASAYSRALALDPARASSKAISNAEVLAARGALEEAAGLAASVKARAREGLSMEESRRLLRLEARIAMASDDRTGAAKVLEEILALDPLDGEALLLLGEHCARTEDPHRALLLYERAAGLEAFEARATTRQAQVLVSLGRYGEALPLLRRSQELRPSEMIARYIEQVERASRTTR